MTQEEKILGNDEICRMLGWESDKVYVYKVPNLFPATDIDTGWTEFDVQNVGFNMDWNILIGAYNIALTKLQGLTSLQTISFEDKKNFIVMFGTRNFFHLFNNQLSINSCWIKLVDFSKWYNSVKHLK